MTSAARATSAVSNCRVKVLSGACRSQSSVARWRWAKRPVASATGAVVVGGAAAAACVCGNASAGTARELPAAGAAVGALTGAAAGVAGRGAGTGWFV